MQQFDHYIGIDYSGARTPTESLRSLRVYLADRENSPREVLPPPSPRKYWSRRGIAEWLVTQFLTDQRLFVGMDHGFSFPWAYFEKYGLAPDWPNFLDDFQHHWPTDVAHTYVDFIRDGLHGNGAARSGNSRWRRLTELRTGRAKSVFHFDCQGSVAKSTHAGLPWLRFLRQRCGSKIHFWPFDGWQIPTGVSAMAEVYPALWMKQFAVAGRTDDQHAAFAIAAWLRNADLNGLLPTYLQPQGDPQVRKIIELEGWILGVT